jgi:hypothetical protein
MAKLGHRKSTGCGTHAQDGQSRTPRVILHIIYLEWTLSNMSVAHKNEFGCRISTTLTPIRSGNIQQFNCSASTINNRYRKLKEKQIDINHYNDRSTIISAPDLATHCSVHSTVQLRDLFEISHLAFIQEHGTDDARID